MFEKMFLFVALLVIGEITGSYIDEKRLHEHLMTDYNKSVRPSRDAGVPVNIQFQILIHKLRSYDLKSQILVVSTFTMMQWVDPQLTWNVTEYGGIRRMNFLNTDIWTPDVVLYNSAYEERESSLDTYPTRPFVTFDGRIIWKMPVIFYVACRSDITWFPVDQQVCTLQFGSWSYSKLQVKLSPWLVNHTFSGKESFDVPNGEWKIKEEIVSYKEASFPCCVDPFSMMNHTITFNHLSSFYFIYILLPMTALCFVFLLVFCIPIESGERLGFGVTVILSISVYLLVISDKLPQKSDVRPFIGIVFVGEFFILCFGLAMSAISVTIHANQKYGPIFLRKLAQVSKKKGKNEIELVTNTNQANNPGEASHEENKTTYVVNKEKKMRAKKVKEEWQILARFLDRFGFGFTLFMLIFYPIVVALSISKDGLQ